LLTLKIAARRPHRRMALRALVLCGMAAAANAAGPSVDVDISTRQYKARETDDGLVLNREEGTLHGLAFSVAVDSWGGRWTLHAANESGTLLYAGQNQSGLPVVTLTDLNVQQVALRWTPAWHLVIGPASLESHAELAHQSIERAIRQGPGSLPLTENLQALWLRSGAAITVSLAPDWSVQFGGQLAWQLAQQLHVDSFGIYDEFTLQPRARLSTRLSAGITWHARPDLHIGLHASQERWRFGPASEEPIYRGGVLAGDAEYPGSRQRLNGFDLQLTRWF
jgi:hypothetical protein